MPRPPRPALTVGEMDVNFKQHSLATFPGTAQLLIVANSLGCLCGTGDSLKVFGDLAKSGGAGITPS